MTENKSYSRDFESWYQNWKNRKTDNAGRHGRFGERHGHRSTASQVSSVLENAVETIVDAVDTVLQKQKQRNPQSRILEENYRKVVRKLEKAERDHERKKKWLVIWMILAFIGLVSTEVSAIVIFAGLAVYTGYNVYEQKRKVERLSEQCRNYEEMNFPEERQYREKVILQHAYAHNGRVYPEVMALESKFSLSEIEHMLAICVDKHIASIELDDNGRTYYYFASFDNFDPYANL